MKNFLTNILRSTLRRLARLTIWSYRPGIVGVTGSVGKTSTKLAIQAVLGKSRRVRVSPGNLNNDLGLPLAILGDWRVEELKLVTRDTPAHTARVRKSFFWVKVIFVSAWRLAAKSHEYP